MKSQIPLKIKNPSSEFKTSLDNLMRVFSSAQRYAFNRLLEGMSTNDLIKFLPTIFKINKRYAEDSVLLAKAIIDSQKELLPMQIQDIKSKISKTIKKINHYQSGKKKPKKVDLETCLEGLNSRLEKLQKREVYLKGCLEDGTIPKVIFGGRKNFYNRMKGKISNEEWKDLRSNHVYSRGDKSKLGNLNIRLIYEEDRFYIEVADTLNVDTKTRISPRIREEVIVPDKYFNQVIDVILPDIIYDSIKNKNIEIYIPYTVMIKRKNNEYYIHLTIEEEVPGRILNFKESIIDDKIAGIDINIDRITLTILSKNGNFLKSKVFYYHDIEHVSSNRRDNIAGEVAKEVTNYLLHENIRTIVIEDLKFSQDHDTNKKYNRLTCSFAKRKLMDTLIRRALRNGFFIKKVNPAYTSVIGRFKYSKVYGLSVHEAASLVIGRRGLGFDEKIPKEIIELLQKEVKPHIIKTLGSMEEAYKKSDSGKSRRKYLGMLLNNIEAFKQNHSWKMWNVIHKALKYREFQLSILLG